jgi:hypothetical protein
MISTKTECSSAVLFVPRKSVDQKFGTNCCEKKGSVLALPIFEEVNNLSPLTQEETRKITIFSTPGTGTGQTCTIVHIYILYSTMAGFICCILHYTGQEG